MEAFAPVMSAGAAETLHRKILGVGWIIGVNDDSRLSWNELALNRAMVGINYEWFKTAHRGHVRLESQAGAAGGG
jgi:hypothetical protein